MDHLVSTVVLATSSNIDNLGVGVAYGVQRRTIGFYANLLIAIVSGIGTLVSMSAGEWVNDYMSEELANSLGSAIMTAIGVLTVAQALRERATEATREAADASVTSSREAIALALSLTLNNLGTGLGAGISHVSIPFTTALTFGLSVTAIATGNFLGKRASRSISKRRLGVLSGLVIVAIGVYEYFV